MRTLNTATQWNWTPCLVQDFLPIAVIIYMYWYLDGCSGSLPWSPLLMTLHDIWLQCRTHIGGWLPDRWQCELELSFPLSTPSHNLGSTFCALCCIGPLCWGRYLLEVYMTTSRFQESPSRIPLRSLEPETLLHNTSVWENVRNNSKT